CAVKMAAQVIANQLKFWIGRAVDVAQLVKFAGTPAGRIVGMAGVIALRLHLSADGSLFTEQLRVVRQNGGHRVFSGRDMILTLSAKTPIKIPPHAEVLKFVL